MLWPGLTVYGDWALLALRLMVAAIFFWSGLEHARKPKERGKSIGMSPAFTLFLGVAGTYRKHDNVDVVYAHGGRRTVASLEPVVDEAAGE